MALEWHAEKNVSLTFSYERQRELANDWNFDGLSVDSISNVVSLGETYAVPDYKTDVYLVSMKYLF